MKLKVNKAKLVAAIEKRRDEVAKELKEALDGPTIDKAHAEFALHMAPLSEKYAKALRTAKNTEAIRDAYHTYYNNSSKGLPYAPVDSIRTLKDRLAKFDEVLKRLALVPEETISIDEHDFYFQY